jgi:DNA polymerase I-like protein with 3'-5' exonuclease and polymerase domains
MQNLPSRDDELCPLVRGMFVPDDGDAWERHDMSQIEYRLLAHFAVGPGAEECRQKYRSDPKTDYHKFCSEMLGIDPNDKRRRVHVKGINFAKGYGAAAPKLAEIIGCSVAEAQDFVDEYERALPFTKSTYDAAMRWGEKQGYVTTVLGRRQRFTLWEPVDNWDKENPPLRYEQALQAYGKRIKRYKTYAALNRKLQGSGADIMKKSIVDCYEAGLTAIDALGAPLLTVHDELDWDVPPTARGETAAKEAKHLMEAAVTLKVPVYVEATRGQDWGKTS